MRIGFIGTGSMGSMLARGYCEVANPDIQVLACNRSRGKLDQLKQEYSSIQIVETIQELVRFSDVLFLCTKPTDAREILDDIKHIVSDRQYLVSINSAVGLNEMEDILPCYVTKIIPSIAQEARSGIILTMFGTRMDHTQRLFMQKILGYIGTPEEIPEDKVRIYSDLTSCGPAFFSFILREWVTAAANEGDIPIEQATTMALKTLDGFVKLVLEKGFTMNDILKRVTVPGGVTAVGLEVLDPTLHDVFSALFQATRSHQHGPKKL